MDCIFFSCFSNANVKKFWFCTLQGYNGSQLWDTAFTVQAILATTDLIEEFGPTLKLAHEYIKNTQVNA